MVKLIASVDQLAENVRRYNKNAAKLADLMPYNRAWYALRTKQGWLLGPSKFVGYDITPEEYLGSAYSSEKHGRVVRDREAPLDGRVTEGVLQRWSILVEQGHPAYDELHTALNELCGRYGKKPNTLARISIIKTEAEHEATPPIDDDLVALLAAVFRRLTPAQQSAFRREVA